MRLIDADAWIENLCSRFVTPNYHPDLGDAFQCMESEQRNEYIYDLITDIKEQPTAYDVDKVVERLENQKDMYCRNDDELELIAEVCDDAIEIVKGDVKDE